MKNIFLILFCAIFFACSPKVITDGGENNVGNVMMNSINKKMSIYQFDSLCIADTLPRSFEYWELLGLKEYEDKKAVSLFMYIKRSGTDESVYRVEETMDDSVKVIKRIIKD